MFRRLRERIAEEATKFPVGQLANNSGKVLTEPENRSTEANSTEDLITLSDSSSVVVPHTSPQQFSIGEDDDGSLSEKSTPQKKQNSTSGDTNSHHSSNSSNFDFSFGQEYRPSKKLSYVPQSDIESEREDPPTLNLDGISKDQLMSAIQSLKAKSYKYKNKYAEVVKNFKELREEKIKIENTLIENQDKGLRRIAELREQCQLEQKAKAHLEENLRLLLEEKDSRICVLETQINLLKEGGKSSSTKALPEDCDNYLSDAGSGDTKSEDSATSLSNDVSILQEKVERLNHQINQDKKTITAQKDQISLLRKQNENLSQELEEKVKRLNNIEDEQIKFKLEHENILKNMQDRLKELEKQQEENIMSMAETKRNMHEELELKEKQLIKAEEESKQYQALAEQEKETVTNLKKQYEEKIKQLQHQLELTEKTLEDEKQSLLHELAQGKTAAINLMQQECAKKIVAVEEEWKAKCAALQNEIDDLSISLKRAGDKLILNEQQVEELNSSILILEKENASLKNSVEKLESEIAQNTANYEKLKVSYSDYECLKEKENLLKIQEAINRELNDKVITIDENFSCKLKEKEDLIITLENEKKELIKKNNEYETSQKEIKINCESLKNEIKIFKENLSNQVNCVENLTEENINKSRKIDKLQEELKKAKINENLAMEKLNVFISETKDFETENANLLLNNRLLNDQIENLKYMLHNKEKELHSVNETFSKAKRDITELNESLDMKENMLKQVIINFKQSEYYVSSLEQQQASIYLKLQKFQDAAKVMQKKCNHIFERLQFFDSNNYEMNYCILNELENTSKSDLKISTVTRDVNNCAENFESSCITNKEISFKSLQVDSNEILHNNMKVPSLDMKSRNDSKPLNVQNLQGIVDGLKVENTRLKEELYTCKATLELQDNKFAKNIATLQQSFSELQKEQNNLCLILQNIANTELNKASHDIQNKNKKVEEIDDLNCNWERNIAELNAKMKSEVDAISFQAEVVNKEINFLREQFKSDKNLYSEKLGQLNSKLLIRTQALINLKENLDSSIENCNCLKQLLEEAKRELNEKNECSILENNKVEFENKYRDLKQEYLEKENELKEAHNSQVINLKNQTKITVEKLNDQIKKLNQQFKAKDEEFSVNISNIKKEYEMQISDLKNQLKNMFYCQEEINNKFLDLSNSLETKVFNSISKLDNYSAKILSLSYKLNHFASKLKEKDDKIFQLNSILLNLQQEIKNNTTYHKDFNNLQNELNLSSQLLQDANKELEVLKAKVKSYEDENSHLQVSFENASKEIQMLSSKINDNDKLKLILDSTNQELESLKVKHSETLSELNNLNFKLKELKEKYSITLIDSDNFNKHLNQQKIHLEQQNSFISELINIPNIVTSHLDNMSDKFNICSEKINIMLNEKETKLKNIESSFHAISSDYIRKVKETSDLRVKLAFYLKNSGDNKKKMLVEEQEKSKNLEKYILEWKTKYENSIKEIDHLSFTNQNVNLQLEKKEIELNNVKTKLDTAEQEIKKFRLEMKVLPEIQEKLKKSLEDLQNYQKLLNEHIEKITVIEKEKLMWEQKYNEQLGKLTTVEYLKHELEQKYNEHIVSLKAAENEKCEWELKYNEQIEKVTVLENEKIAWTQKYEEQTEKLLALKNEKNILEQKYDEQIRKQKTIEREKCEWEAKYNEQVQKLTIIQNQKHELELKYREQLEKLTALETEKIAWTQSFKEQTEKLSNIENEKYEYKLKYYEAIDKLKATEKEILAWEQKYNEQVEKISILENEKHEKELKYKEQNERLTVVEKEKHDWELKHNEIFKDMQNVSISALKDKEKIQQLLAEIETKSKKINSMISPKELDKLKQSYDIEIQKHVKLTKNLQLELKLLSESLSDKEAIIKAKKSEKENLEVQHEESLRCMKDKLQNAEKNYKTQIEEMKLKINQLEKENSILQSEKENLLIVQNQFKELKNGEEKIRSELKSKEEELNLLKEKLDSSNKEQIEKIHSFQENMKDKENMILKLKTNIECMLKEHKESIEELHKKIKKLEIEREQLMLQAQERVSATEAKCRENIKLLQEKCDKLLLENSEIEKSLLVAESNQATANQEIFHLKDKLINTEKKLADVEKTKSLSESEFSNKLEKLQQENKLLLHNSDHVEKLKVEKEELNEKLKTAVQQVNKINILQKERDQLKGENEELSKEIKHIRTLQNENSSIREKLKLLEENEDTMSKKIEILNSENETLKSEIVSLKSSFKVEKDSLLLEKEKLLNQIQQLESCVKDPQIVSVQNYLETLKKDYEMAIKAKDDDMLAKLKQLVRDFSIQMDVKDKDSAQMITELMEKNQYLEENLQREHASLIQDVYEKERALEEMRESYEEIIQDKNTKIKEQEMILKNLVIKDSGIESVHNIAEQSDWDDTWVVPDEAAEHSSPNQHTKTCEEHVHEIVSLQEELSKCNSEIKELKLLLRLSPPENMVNNNNRRDSLHSLPEPTEFEYLKNIIYEYMMGKEPVTLAKVIAAVLRFNDVQTQQVIRREESRHHTK